MKRSSPHEMLAFHLKVLGAPEPVHEHRFHPVRKFRFDLAWPDYKLATEVDGGVWTGGRHTRGAGHISDAVKRNLAVEEGWWVLTYVPEQIRSGEAAQQVIRVLKSLGQSFPQSSTR